jgi:hypothetical protein
MSLKNLVAVPQSKDAAVEYELHSRYSTPAFNLKAYTYHLPIPSPSSPFPPTSPLPGRIFSSTIPVSIPVSLCSLLVEYLNDSRDIFVHIRDVCTYSRDVCTDSCDACTDSFDACAHSRDVVTVYVLSRDNHHAIFAFPVFLFATLASRFSFVASAFDRAALIARMGGTHGFSWWHRVFWIGRGIHGMVAIQS